MAKTLKDIENEVKDLTFSDKEILLQKLIDELAPLETEWKDYWLSEVQRRREELLTGKVKGIPVNEAMSELKRRMNERGNSSSRSVV